MTCSAHPKTQAYWLISAPKAGFTKPRFVFGQVVKHPNSGIWGTVIGMSYIHPDFKPNWTPGWDYDIRFHEGSCDEEYYDLMSGTDTFPEDQLEEV